MLLLRRAAKSQTEVRSQVAHLVRRLAFGLPAAEIDALAELGYDGAVDALCRFDRPDPGADAVEPPTFRTADHLAARRSGDDAARAASAAALRDERRGLVLWWVRRMVAAQHPAQEKLTFLWHDHFATSLRKVQYPELMHLQQRTLHRFGPGRFDELVHEVARDPAMLIWLDGRSSTGRAPNENFARELLELFTLGHAGHHGAGSYTEQDVAAAARALTGWVIDPTRGARFVPSRHDDGTKSLLGVSGPLGLDEVVSIVTSHPACAPHVVASLWSKLVAPAAPDAPAIEALAAEFARDLDGAALVRRIVSHPEFLAPSARGALVRPPVDYVVGIARSLSLELDERVLLVLAGLGQVPFAPPDVDGWPTNEPWLSTSSALLRLQLATAVASQPAVVDQVPARSSQRADALARLLGVDGWSEATASAIGSAASPADAVTVAIVSPEVVVA
jgi:uncharacterized protein (DUF1800 family)